MIFNVQGCHTAIYLTRPCGKTKNEKYETIKTPTATKCKGATRPVMRPRLAIENSAKNNLKPCKTRKLVMFGYLGGIVPVEKGAYQFCFHYTFTCRYCYRNGKAYKYVPSGHGSSEVSPAGQYFPLVQTLPHSSTPSSNVGVGLVALYQQM